MSSDWEMEHFGTPDEPGAPGHRAWVREQKERARQQAEQQEAKPTLNDELAIEARRTSLLGVASLARRGTKHDPEL